MPKPNDLIIDSFAGGGGASLGIEWALGRGPDVAINHNPAAIEMHRENHPGTHHYTEDVFRVNPVKATSGKPVGLLWASPDCFPAGTLVLTPAGLAPIERVREGQFVLTHKNRWRRVTSTMSKTAETVAIRGHGHWGLVTTPDHQIYSKRVTHRYPKAGPDGKRPGGVRELVENPYWPEAKDMAGKLWATPLHVPASMMPQCDGAEFGSDFFYFLGRWVGDGSLNKGDVEICCGNDELDVLVKWFADHPLKNAAGEVVPCRVVDHGTSKLLVWGSIRLVEYLRAQFGDSCESKRLPAWLLSAQASWRRSFLDGYVDADGHVADGIITTSSVSRSLSVGVRLLAVSLGLVPAMYFTEGKPGEIEGRSFMGRGCYRVRWRIELKAEQCHRDTTHLFSPVREVEPTGRTETVYCLEVEEDESYTADGIVVHNCRHHSRARGGKPVAKNIRGLAWAVIKWADAVRPRVIVLENVREFADWGPLCPRWDCSACKWRGTQGQAALGRRGRRACPQCEGAVTETEHQVPDPDRKGVTFRQFCGRLRGLGYHVEHRVLNAADYGAPTHRRRLFLVARCDGLPIQWPEPTHGDPAKIGRDLFSADQLPWRTAAECIDWSIPCPSIFDRKKPLAEKTLKRIAHGVKRYVLDNPRPFLVPVRTHGGGGNDAASLDAPLRTVTCTKRGEFALVNPLLAHLTHGGERRAHPADEPTPTVTGANRGELGLIAPVVANLAHGESADGRDRGLRANGPEAPLGTVHAGGGSYAVVAPYLYPRYGEKDGSQAPRTASVEAPMPTVVQTGNGAMLCSAFIAKHFGGMVGVRADTPLPTTTARGTQNQLAAVNLVHMNHGEKQWNAADEPLRTVTTGGHAALVASFMVRYFGKSVATPLTSPLPTACGEIKDGLVTVSIAGEPFVIVDIGMRMLKPRELARAQGFPDSYRLTGSATSQVERIGNSVCPHVAAALVRANCGDLARKAVAA